MRHALLAFLLLTCTAHAAEDPFRLTKLEQDVRNLERQVQSLSRELAALRAQLGREGEAVRIAPADGVAPTDTSASWLDAANWARVRPGMEELQVIKILGPPTSMREENGARVLLYAMEIGSSGFLSGNVTLAERRVKEAHRPVLK